MENSNNSFNKNNLNNFNMNIKILYLEDSELDIEIINEYLQSEGFDLNLDTASTERDFVNLLKNNTYDLILSDFNLNGFDGFKSLNLSKLYSPDVPFICISGAIGEEKAVELLKQGATDFISKNQIGGLTKAIIRAINEQKEIKARRLAEKALFESEIKFRSYIEFAPYGIFIVDPLGNFINMNPEACNLLLYTKEELLNMHATDIIKKEDLDKVADSLVKLKSVGKYNEELKFLRKDGTSFDGLLDAVKISETSYLGFVKNIDDIKNKELELIKALSKAEESDRLKSAFLANLSHEIRTPLNGILGFSKFLTEPDLTNVERIEFVYLLNNSCNRLTNTINDILEISRIDSGQIEIKESSFQISEVFSELYELHSINLKNKNIEFFFEIDSNLENKFIISDAKKIHQILDNLLSNSFKFTKFGTINFGCSIQNNQIEFFVKDTGVGISEKAQEYIFGKFNQEDLTLARSYEGSGLGLAICKGLTEILGGHISFISKKGVGSTFYFTIPLKYSDETGISKNKIIENIDYNKDYSDKKILIAEDDFSNFLYLEKIIKNDTKALIIHAEDGLEVLEFLKKYPDISIIIMDIKMPTFDGYETTLKIRENNKSIPILAVTALALNSDFEKALEVGCNDYLSKPFNSKEIITKVRSLLK